uniref:Uncharacterized protein n=1 Tax=Rhizophora mucronata TaxID=61149 RepID=A0A2P2PG15_RHIMU
MFAFHNPIYFYCSLNFNTLRDFVHPNLRLMFTVLNPIVSL